MGMGGGDRMMLKRALLAIPPLPQHPRLLPTTPPLQVDGVNLEEWYQWLAAFTGLLCKKHGYARTAGCSGPLCVQLAGGRCRLLAAEPACGAASATKRAEEAILSSQLQPLPTPAPTSSSSHPPP